MENEFLKMLKNTAKYFRFLDVSQVKTRTK